MKKNLTKIKLIYLPFLIIAIVFIISYSFLNWFFVIKFKLVNINEELVNFWLPAGLSCVPVLIWLRPCIKLLSLKTKRDNLPFLYYFIAIAAIVAPTIIIQDYLITATGELTMLQNVDQLNKKPLTKYYKIKTHFIDKQYPFVYRRAEVSGRNNEYLTLHIYLVCPIVSDTFKHNSIIKSQDATHIVNNFNFRNGEKPLIVIDAIPVIGDTLPRKLKSEDIASITILKGAAAKALYGKMAPYGAILVTTKKVKADNSNAPKKQLTALPIAWLGTEYKKSLSNHLSDIEKENSFKEFDSDTYKKFISQDLDYFTYLDRIGYNDRHKGYLAAIKTLNIHNNRELIILEAKTEPFETRNGNKFGWIFKSFGIGAGIWLIMITIPQLNNQQLKKFDEHSLQAGMVAFYKPLLMLKWQNSNVTAILIALNVFIFIIMVFAGLGVISFDSHDLYNWGANYRPAVLNGQWWRLITSMFLHGGLMHLIMNMYGLIFAAIFLQPLLGNIKIALVYFICGISASVTSIWWHPATISVGASGAIFGLYGVATALLTTKKAGVSTKKTFLISYLIFISINLLFGFISGIDNAAHIGGLLSGFIMGYLLYFFLDTPKPHQKTELEKNPN